MSALALSLMTLDRMGRPLHDLRISVTDRCNFRCTYCMPKEIFGRDFEFMPRQDLLSFEEIAHFVRVAAPLGLDYYSLKRRVDEAGQRGRTPTPAFIEVHPRPRPRRGVCSSSKLPGEGR